MEDRYGIHKVYTLLDPTNNQIRYVGVTWLLIENRLATHLSCKLNKEKHKWILGLKKQGLMPIIEIVEYIDYYYYNSEQYWISQFNTWGFDLFNKKHRTSKYRNI